MNTEKTKNPSSKPHLAAKSKKLSPYESAKDSFKMSGATEKIQNMRTSLHQFPSFAKKEMDEQGNAYLSNCVHKTHKCGCEIIGNGTLQNPLEIKFCKKHKTP